MIKQYIKQAIGTLKESRLTSLISILGTALSVAMILVVVLQFQVRQTEYSPVSNRSRMLYIYSIVSKLRNGNETNNTGLSYDVIRECIYSLKTPAAATAIAGNTHVVSLPGKQLFDEYQVSYTDPGFWKVFDFRFLYGKPFTEADFNSGLSHIVVTGKLARTLFGTEDVVGRDILMNNVMPCTIVGVVKEPSQAATEAYADIWLPYTSNSLYTGYSGCEGISGSFGTVILANDAADFDAIKAEIKREVARCNSGKVEYDMQITDLSTSTERALGFGMDDKDGWRNYLGTTGMLLLFLLLVPTLNLTGVIQSSVQKRRPEMGLRRAFGATQGRLFNQIISENLVITMIGGVLGIVMSVVLLYLGKSFLLSGDMVITFDMLFKPGLFVAALFFTLLLNILSSGIPAYRVIREQIVEALKDDKQ